MNKILVAMICLCALACSKQPPKVRDPGPQFSFKSEGPQLESSNSLVAELKRDDPNSGPIIAIDPVDPTALVSVDKKLVCGSAEITGQKRSGSDLERLNFRLSDNEFPGLKTLPMKSECQLYVIATNSRTSTVTRTFNLSLRFDKPQSLNAVWEFAGDGYYVLPASNPRLIVTRLTVTNEFNYPLYLNYHFAFSPPLAPCYNLTPAVNPGNTGVNCAATTLPLQQQDLYVSDQRKIIGQSTDNTVQFRLDPRDRLVIQGALTVPSDLTKTFDGPLGGRYGNWGSWHKVFAGVYALAGATVTPLEVAQEAGDHDFHFTPAEITKKSLPSVPLDYRSVMGLP